MMNRSSISPDALRRARILKPEWLLSVSGPKRDQAVVLDDDGCFAAVGDAAALQKRYPALPVLELPRRLLMPGFVDAHHHLTQSYGKALVFGEPSEIFRRVWVPLERTLNSQHLHAASRLAALEALRGGFTTVCDAGTRSPENLDAIAQATNDVGIRCVLGLICNDRTPEGVADPAPLLARAQAHLADRARGLVTPSLAVSIPEAATDGMLSRVYRLSEEAGRVFQTHANEHLVAVERSLDARGLRPIEHLEQVGALGPAALLAHATLVTPREVRLLADSGTAVAYNPVASAWKGNAVAPAESMAIQGVRMGLGTDGTRSDGFRLLDYAESAQRFAFGMSVGDSSCGAGWTWLDMGTRGAADAVGLGAVTGSIEARRAADFLVIDLDVPELTPSWDLPWELVRLANRDQIEAVFVGGTLRLWQGWPLDWDARALMAEIRDLAESAVRDAPIRKLHAPSTDRMAAHALRPLEPA